MSGFDFKSCHGWTGEGIYAEGSGKRINHGDSSFYKTKILDHLKRYRNNNFLLAFETWALMHNYCLACQIAVFLAALSSKEVKAE
jgi:hypothetical protein